MAIADLQPKQGKVDVVVEVVSMDEPREFNKFGKTGRVCNATVKDETGQIKLTLWNDDIDKVKPGMKIHIENGYVNEWQGEMQLTTGRFGKMEILEGDTGPTAAEATAPTAPQTPAPEQTPQPAPEVPQEDASVEEESI